MRAPKTKRKEYPHAFRLDVAGKKFIFSVAGETELENWKSALQEGSGTGIGMGTVVAVENRVPNSWETGGSAPPFGLTIM